MDGDVREGVNDNDGDTDKTLFGIAPKTGSPGREGLELAPAAPDTPDTTDGTETFTDRTWARVGTAPRVMDRMSASVCLMSLMDSL